MKLGNRDLTGADFRWIDEAEITSRSLPRDAVYVERREYGPFIGAPVRLSDGETGAGDRGRRRLAALQPLVAKAADDREHIRRARARRDRRRQLPRSKQSVWRRARLELRAAGGSAVDVAAATTAIEQRLADSQDAVRRGRRAPRRGRRAGLAHARDARGRRRHGEGAADARHLPRLPRQRALVRRAGRRLREPPVGVPRRRSARIEHRGRHLPGDLRHRHDGACS